MMLHNIHNKRLTFIISLGAAFAVTMIILALSAAAETDAISRRVLRFHIVAASDSKEDQNLKLKVRDGIAELTGELFSNVETKEQATAVALENKERIVRTAETILRENGCNDTVQMEIKNLYFPTKQYDNIAFPAGNYDAIHITIGEGRGHNFWCVMFPALCVPGVTKPADEVLRGTLDTNQIDMVTHPYAVKFKLAEWWGALRHWLTK